MKKVLLIILLLVLFGCGKKDDFSYTLNDDDTYTIDLLDNVEKKKINIPEEYNDKQITMIDGFKSNRYVEEIIIPKTIKKITEISFEGCLLLTEIKVDEDNEIYKSIDGNIYKDDELIKYACGKHADSFVSNDIKKVGKRAFYNAKYLEEVTLENVEEIDDQAFNHCYKLETINLGSKIKVINSCFNYCDNLKKINISEENNYLKTIDGSVYSKDGSKLLNHALGIVKNVFINVNEIADYAYSTSRIEEIIIGNNVKKIGNNAFNECNYLENIYIQSEEIASVFSNEYSYIGSVSCLYLKDNLAANEYITSRYNKKELVTYKNVNYYLFEVK